MNQRIKQVLLVCVCLLVLTGRVIADSQSDEERILDVERAFDAGDYVKAAKLLRPLAEQGLAQAQFNLGMMYALGNGVPQDYTEAVKWHRLAAKQGHANAQFNLGLMYAKGNGVPQDYKEAAKWYQLASEKGIAEAQDNLGSMYSKGNGVPQDYKEAMKWHQLAAEHGLANSQLNLGVMYGNGQGVLKDNALAYMWAYIAATNETNSEIRGLTTEVQDLLAKRMDSNQITEAQALARKCTANKFKGC